VATVRARRALEAATEPLAEEGEVGARLDLARAVLERRQAARGRLEEAVQRYVQASPREQAELLGMLGGARRWDAWLLERLSGDVAHAERPLPDTLASLLPGADPEALRGASTAALRDAKELYFRAFRADPGTHWVAAQHLVLSVALGERDLDRRIVSTAALTAELALRDADEAARAWALATILELRLLESVLQEDLGVRGPDAMACARELTGLVGSRSPQAAHAAAQLRRLHTWWATASTNDALVDLIDRTLRILDPDGPR
jgi:hypothetical protein